MIPGPVGAIATICDIGLSYATGDFSALGKSLLSAIITGGFKTYINNACKIPKALKYIAGAVFAGYGLSIISKSYIMIRDSALQFVDLMFSGGSPLDYAHVLCNFFQGLAGLAGGVGFAVGSAVGMVRQCFVAGTKVKTEDGDKNIEDIEEGDLVWAYDPVTGETGLKEVKQTFENETETLVHVTVSDGNVKETIDTTVRHPFYVVGYGFRFASELRVGDKVLSVSGDIYEVTSVEIEDLDEPVKIYNFEVEDWHTYFVSESGILVHNQGCGTGTPNTTEDETNKTSNTIEHAGQYYQDSNGRWHRSNGQFASNVEVGLPNSSNHYLHRPYIRKSTIDGVNANTKIDYETGKIYDEISMNENGERGMWVDPQNVELGHRTDFEFWYLRDMAEAKGMTQAEFNDFMNNPEFYGWQDISSNRSHKSENPHN